MQRKITYHEKNRTEFIRALSYCSDKINDIKIENNNIIIVYNDEDALDIEKKLELMLEKYSDNAINSDDQIIYHTGIEKRHYHKQNDMTHVHCNQQGQIILDQQAILLFEYFDQRFASLFSNTTVKRYPILLPMKSIEKTGYLKNSPQYIYYITTGKEDITSLSEMYKHIKNEDYKSNFVIPKHTLSPSACFHCYDEYENTEFNSSKIFTFKQHVFRNEGRFNWYEFGRLSDYCVREIVFFGAPEFVSELREEAVNNTKKIIEELELNAKICITHDPFVIPVMQRFKKIQKLEKSKYELQIAYDDNHSLAVASFNLHGTAFTDSFKIKIKDNENTVSGCVGFGLERWVLTFYAQYGEDVARWPLSVKNYLKNRRGIKK